MPMTSIICVVIPPSSWRAGQRARSVFAADGVAVLADTDDDLKPARRFMNGIAIAMPRWCLIGLPDWPRLAV
jgi:hypothetical protein